MVHSPKGGVTSSSLEVLAALSLTDEEFTEHMTVKDGDFLIYIPAQIVGLSRCKPRLFPAYSNFVTM